MSKVAYTFSVLRYVHDPASQEFANIGVALYSKERRYLDALCAVNYGRITRMFGSIDGYRFRQITRYIQDQVHRIGQELSASLPFEAPTLEKLLAMVLPPDDSAFQFSPAGVGLTDDLGATLKDLFKRFVERYSSPSDLVGRDKQEVWKVYREPLERRKVTAYLSPKKIIAPNYEYEFEHSWKNEVHHLYEPVSFDLIEPTSILDKANRWVGRATSLADSKEKFRLHLLLGEPQGPGLENTFIKAQNILHKMPGNPELIREREAEGFAEELEHEIKAHIAEDGDPRR